MPISKKMRFEVFKRDGFKCGYCGKCPPDITLEVDHINPKSKGGKDNINNLITACFDCNRGKKNIVLEKIPNSMGLNLEILKEQQSQLNAYNKYLEKLNKQKLKDAREIISIYENYHKGYTLSDHFVKQTLLRLLSLLPKQTIKEAMENSCLKNKDIRYFCGICWNIIKKR